MRGLTLEERGAYNTLLDLIYENGGPVFDDERQLAGEMGVSVRKWRQVRAALIARGRIYCIGGVALMDALAAEEIEKQQERRRLNAESGATGGRKSAEKRAKPKENSEGGQAVAQGSLKLETEDSSDPNGSGAARPVEAEVLKSEIPDREGRNKEAWTWVVRLLVERGGMRPEPARKFFGRLLSAYKLEAGCLRKAILAAEEVGTTDPRAYLTRAAASTAEKLKTMLPKEIDPIDWPLISWQIAYRFWRERGTWEENMGPPPGQPGCRVPPEVLITDVQKATA